MQQSKREDKEGDKHLALLSPGQLGGEDEDWNEDSVEPAHAAESWGTIGRLPPEYQGPGLVGGGEVDPEDDHEEELHSLGSMGSHDGFSQSGHRELSVNVSNLSTNSWESRLNVSLAQAALQRQRQKREQSHEDSIPGQGEHETEAGRRPSSPHHRSEAGGGSIIGLRRKRSSAADTHKKDVLPAADPPLVACFWIDTVLRGPVSGSLQSRNRPHFGICVFEDL